MESLRKAWPAVASALLLAAALPPLNLGLLAFVALVPWLTSLRQATGWGSFRSGYFFGVVFLLCQMSWLQPLVQRWTDSFGLSLVPVILAPLIGGFYFSLFAWLARYCWLRRWSWMIPVVWAGVEVFRSYCPGLAFPWGLLATPLWPFPALLQLGWLGTVFLTSAWLALINVFVSRMVAGESFMAARTQLYACIVLAVFSVMRYQEPLPGQKTPISVGQLGLDLAFGDKAHLAALIGPTVERLQETASLGRTRLLVLPEGLVRGATGIPPEIPFQIRPGVPILFGGQRGAAPTYQSAFAYDGAWSYADKTRLVVFGEYVPGRDYLPFLTEFRLPTGDLTPGEKVSALEVGGLKVGPLLCFEGLFPDVALAQARNQVQLLAVMALDDWYFGTQAPEQLMTAAVFRAIETGLPVVRSAPLGYSVAVNAKGEILAQAPLRESVAMRVEVPVPNGPGAFAGVWVFLYAAPLASFVVFLEAIRDRKRQPVEFVPAEGPSTKKGKPKRRKQ
jgi:apolipoprotein N-acyltransferase